MAAPLSPTRIFVCDACQATLPYEARQAGKKCRCGKCGKILTIPGKVAKTKPKPLQQYSFACMLCETRLVATANHVGKKMKCPDCGTLNKIPAAPKPRPKQIPKAMHGQQYGVWDVNDAPLPEEIAAYQPKFFPVYCNLCDTLMHAHEKQIGQKLTCPDCGSKTTVLEPKKEKEKPSVLVPDGEEYQLDETQAPTPRPVPRLVAVQDAENRKQYRESLQEEYGEQAKMPMLPLVMGVLPMLLRKPVPVWWLGLSVVLLAINWLIGMLATQHPFIGVCCLALACIKGGIAFCAVSTLCCSILTESSEGNNRLFNPPKVAPHEWLGESLYLAISLFASLIPGALIGKFTQFVFTSIPDELVANIPSWIVDSAQSIAFLGVSLSAFFCFPIFLLSAFEQGSPMDVFSFKLMRSLWHRPLHWFMFYLVTAGVLSASLALGLKLDVPLGIYLSVPILSAAVLLYFRLLGRLAWWLAESMSEHEEEDLDVE